MKKTTSTERLYIDESSEAFQDLLRIERSEQTLRDVLDDFENNFEDVLNAVDSFLAESAGPSVRPEVKSAEKTMHAVFKGSGDLFQSIRSSFDGAFMALMQSIQLTPPAALQRVAARSRNAFEASVGRRPTREIIGLREDENYPSWMPWPPVDADSNGETWTLNLDWTEGGTPPEHVKISVFIDGAPIEDPQVDPAGAGRVQFDVHCPEPVGFELIQKGTASLQMNLVTRIENLS